MGERERGGGPLVTRADSLTFKSSKYELASSLAGLRFIWKQCCDWLRSVTCMKTGFDEISKHSKMASVESDEDPVFHYEWRTAIEKTIENFGNIKKLKSVQEEALLSFIKRRDVLAVLPTGCGKSLIFQVVPGVVKYLSQKGFSFPENPIVLVVCPLNALIKSHIKELKKYEVSACCLTDQEVEEDVKEGKFGVVFANPESLVDNKKWRSMLQSEVYQKNVFGLVTDEAHVVPKW